MTAIVVAGWARIRSEQREEAGAAHRQLMGLARREPACQEFVMVPDPLDADRLLVLEIWSDRDALEHFRSSPAPEGVTLPPEPQELSVREYVTHDVRELTGG